MDTKKPFYFGNAKADQVRGGGWFVGQFVPAELGLRHQTDVELKWGFTQTAKSDRILGQLKTAPPFPC